jgi:hypothetical protein
MNGWNSVERTKTPNGVQPLGATFAGTWPEGVLGVPEFLSPTRTANGSCSPRKDNHLTAFFARRIISVLADHARELPQPLTVVPMASTGSISTHCHDAD